jgi:hypothetical protein
VERIAAVSTHPRSRFLGVIYLLYFLVAIFSQILAGRGLTVYGIAGNIIANLIYFAVTLLFYHLFRPVNKNVSLLAAILSLAGCAVSTLGLFHIRPYNISPLVFFGPFCILIGYLIISSTILPRPLGVLMVVAGVGWLIYLTPLATSLNVYLEALGILAEGSLMLWLLLIGVDGHRMNDTKEPK